MNTSIEFSCITDARLTARFYSSLGRSELMSRDLSRRRTALQVLSENRVITREEYFCQIGKLMDGARALNPAMSEESVDHPGLVSVLN